MLLLACDQIGRIVRYPYEIPVGTVLGVVGAVIPCGCCIGPHPISRSGTADIATTLGLLAASLTWMFQGLGGVNRGVLLRLAGLVHGSGRRVVTVVHEVNYAAAWADHIVALKDGRVVAQGTADAVLTEAVLSALYDTPIEVSGHDGRPLVLHHHWHDQLGSPLIEAASREHPVLH